MDMMPIILQLKLINYTVAKLSPLSKMSKLDSLKSFSVQVRRKRANTGQ